MDLTNYLRKLNLDHDLGWIFIAERLWDDIQRHMNLTCSIGIAPNKMLAKIVSGFKKPNGLTYIDFDAE